MPTTERQRQKRETKRQERRAIRLHTSALAVGHSVALPDPPDFGLPKFTEAEQRANPGKPMTRRVKDFLREGEWKEGFDKAGNPVFGKYDLAELQIILNNALGLMANGDPINLGKSHGDDQMIIPTDELISPVDQVKLHNGVLWFSTYVTPAQAEYLDNPAIKVSAGMFPDYTAGNGKKFQGRTLLHIAATDRPVVGGQGPFIALANYVGVGQATKLPPQQQQKPAPVPGQQAATTVPGTGTVPGQQATKPAATPAVRRPVVPALRVKQRIANFKGRRSSIRFGNSLPVLLASTFQGSGTMDIAALLAAINALLKAFGLGTLPDGTDETNIVPRLEGIALALGGSVDDAGGDAGAAAGGGDGGGGDAGAAAGAVPGGAPAMMANLLRQVDQRIVQANKLVLEALGKLTQQNAAATQQAAETAEQTFMKFYNALGKAGVVEAILAPKKEVASKCGWPTALLEGLHPTIKLSNLVSAAGATTEPPKVPGEGKSGLATDAEVEARIKARGGNPANMPKAGVS